jgi:biopolymer transport protein ExbD
MKARRGGGLPGKVEQNMTPMIDVVFQLLAFFVMTFKLATVEGDFNIKMPISAPSAGVSENPFPPIRLVMKAGAGGQLAVMNMGDRPLGTDFKLLHNEILSLVGNSTGPGSMASQMEVELDCDPALHYTNVIKAITAVSGHMNAQGQVIRLIEKVKFASPKS